jgi:hypothetical protein
MLTLFRQSIIFKYKPVPSDFVDSEGELYGPIHIHLILLFAVVLSIAIIILMTMAVCTWTVILSKYKSIRADRITVIENTNDQIVWM